jgi:branched-chain amino acid aminotransferase
MDILTDIAVQKVEKSRIEEVDLNDPGFGRVFTDHMLEMKYMDDQWKQPVIKPYGPIEITPSLNVLHYGQSVFEGTKAYYSDENTINLFRPEKNYERMVNSCDRLCIPKIDRETFMQGITQLVQMDLQWVPQKEGNSLYIRPFACAWENLIAAHISTQFRFYILLSPVGSYYSRPVRLITSQNYVRAVGQAKTAGNYAASMYPTQKAKELGFDQVLWLDAFEHEYVEEVGTMNIFFLIDDVLITAPLSGTILPGITRDSVLKLARSWGMDVEERRLSMTEIKDAAQSGKLQEVFGAGTAAVISPVKEIRHQGDLITPNEQERGPVGQKLYDTIYGIQRGRIEDDFGWIHPIKVG